MHKCKILSTDWQLTAEGETILQNFYDPQTAGRKLFGKFKAKHSGVLEKPSLPSNFEEVSYKIFVAGKAGIGKTTTTARLAGTVCPSSAYVETMGIRQTIVYWPAKIRDRIVLFKLHLWDAGENSIKKYSHILPACTDKADAVLFVFSFMDQSSLADLPKYMAQLMKLTENPASIAIGTRYDADSEMEIDASEVLEFEQRWRTPVLRINNARPCEMSEVHEVAPILNLICERLWMRAHPPHHTKSSPTR
ncbi:hypothetical protein B566_EDAN002351 [Ephemera danica]|nr:hypothetical protein B566_EDAN002351 [Ephemera danica]